MSNDKTRKLDTLAKLFPVIEKYNYIYVDKTIRLRLLTKVRTPRRFKKQKR